MSALSRRALATVGLVVLGACFMLGLWAIAPRCSANTPTVFVGGTFKITGCQ